MFLGNYTEQKYTITFNTVIIMLWYKGGGINIICMSHINLEVYFPTCLITGFNTIISQLYISNTLKLN